MTIALTRLLTSAEFQVMDKEARARGLWSCDPTVFTPGMGWLMDWYYDPLKPELAERRERGLEGKSFLSVAYWRDWSAKRSPVTVVCPNGEQWCIDQKASNGPGWTITGEWPNITASPSIVVPGYHGFLQGGQFTPDCEGRPPNGIVRPYTPRQAA